MIRRLLIPAAAAASLVAGFATAQVTGARWLGAVVLVVGGLWCAVRLWRVSGPVAAVTVGVVYVVAFVVSHPLGRLIGSWPAVLTVAVITAAFAYQVMRPTGRRDSTTSPPTRSTR